MNRLLTVATALLLLVAIAPSVRAVSSTRPQSDALVADAEKVILDAGKSTPVDTAKVNRAIDLLHSAIKIDPTNDAAYVDLGFSYGLLRDAATAVEMYETATKLNPSPGNFKELADIYMRVGDPENALMAANAGLAKDPNNAPLYNAKGMALVDQHRPEEAEAAFRRALKLDPTLTAARDNLDAVTTHRTRSSIGR